MSAGRARKSTREGFVCRRMPGRETLRQVMIVHPLQNITSFSLPNLQKININE